MKPYVVLEKKVGETPLDVVEKLKEVQPELKDQPVAYAGRLDPMASGKLLLLIGDECKKQKDYHGLDKAYRFEVMLGTSSDTGDVLALLDWKKSLVVDESSLVSAIKKLVGKLSLPYPKFSSKTVQGKPLHLWTLENKLDEIEIPTADTEVYKLKLISLRSENSKDVFEHVSEKIQTIPPVTDESKALGADFRREDVRMDWQVWYENHRKQEVQIATFEAVVSSGTYIRSLAPEIAKLVGATGLAYSIHRTEIGRYQPLPFNLGFWQKHY